MGVEIELYKVIYQVIFSPEQAKEQTPVLMCTAQLNAELVFSILKGITKFSQVSFKDDVDVANQEFFKKTAKEVIPKINGDNATISFGKLKIPKRDWENCEASEPLKNKGSQQAASENLDGSRSSKEICTFFNKTDAETRAMKN